MTDNATTISTTEQIAPSSSNAVPIGGAALLWSNVYSTIHTAGLSGAAGTYVMYPASGNFTTTLGTVASASNTVNFFASVPTNLHLFYCAVATTVCTLTDAGYAYNAIPYADLSGVAPSFGSVTQYGIAYGSSATAISTTAALTANALIKAGSSAAPAASSLVDNGSNITTTEPILVTGIMDGRAPITITTGTSATLGAATYQSGYTFNQEATPAQTVTYTLPATVTGMQYCVKNSAASGTADTGTLIVYPPASSYVILNGTRNTIGGGSTHGVTSTSGAGAAACFVAIDATDWEVYIQNGTWTEN
jgi:hypothetical protein